RGGVGDDRGAPDAQSLDHRQAESLVRRWEHQRAGKRDRRVELCAFDPAGAYYTIVELESVDLRRDLALERADATGEHEMHICMSVRHRRERLYERAMVLAGTGDRGV